MDQCRQLSDPFLSSRRLISTGDCLALLFSLGSILRQLCHALAFHQLCSHSHPSEDLPVDYAPLRVLAPIHSHYAYMLEGQRHHTGLHDITLNNNSCSGAIAGKIFLHLKTNDGHHVKRTFAVESGRSSLTKIFLGQHKLSTHLEET